VVTAGFAVADRHPEPAATALLDLCQATRHIARTAEPGTGGRDASHILVPACHVYLS